jgi:hypothetical protein
MPEFSFDPDLGPAENIERFHRHMATVDPELAELLRNHIGEVLPLPTGSPQRTAKRSAFNRAIAAALDAERAPAVAEPAVAEPAE